MRALFLVMVLSSAGCKRKAAPETPPAPSVNRDPYRNVTPQKFKDKVEKIQDEEEQRNQRRMDEMAK